MKTKTIQTIIYLLGIVMVICAVSEYLNNAMTIQALMYGLFIGVVYYLFTFLARIPILGVIIYFVLVYSIWALVGLVSYSALLISIVLLIYYTYRGIIETYLLYRISKYT
jgi:hypothetical protein